MDDRGAEVFARLVALLLKLSPIVIVLPEAPTRGLTKYRRYVG